MSFITYHTTPCLDSLYTCRQILLNGKIVGNKSCHYNAGSLYLEVTSFPLSLAVFMFVCLICFLVAAAAFSLVALVFFSLSL